MQYRWQAMRLQPHSTEVPVLGVGGCYTCRKVAPFVTVYEPRKRFLWGYTCPVALNGILQWQAKPNQIACVNREKSSVHFCRLAWHTTWSRWSASGLLCLGIRALDNWGEDVGAENVWREKVWGKVCRHQGVLPWNLSVYATTLNSSCIKPKLVGILDDREIISMTQSNPNYLLSYDPIKHRFCQAVITE